MPGLKQIGEQSRDVNNKITTKEFQPWTEALHKQACLAKTGFLAFEVHVFYILEVLHTFLVLFCFSIVETCGLDKCSWCCLKTKNTQHGEATQKPSSIRVCFCLFPVHILLLWLAYGKPNWEIIMLEYFKGMPS